MQPQTIRERSAEPSIDQNGRVRSVAFDELPLADPQERSRFGYWTMVVFPFLHYFRLGNIIPGIASLHLARITAFCAMLALVLGANRVRSRKLPIEVKIILAMFAWLMITISFASWRGGAFAVVFFKFSGFYALSLVGWTGWKLGPISRLSDVALTFVALNAAALAAFSKFIMGQKTVCMHTPVPKEAQPR